MLFSERSDSFFTVGSTEGIGLSTHKNYYPRDFVSSGRLNYYNNKVFKQATVKVYGTISPASKYTSLISQLGQDGYTSFGPYYQTNLDASEITGSDMNSTLVMYIKEVRHASWWRGVFNHYGTSSYQSRPWIRTRPGGSDNYYIINWDHLHYRTWYNGQRLQYLTGYYRYGTSMSWTSCDPISDFALGR